MDESTLYSANAIPTTRASQLRALIWSLTTGETDIYLRIRQLTPDNEIIETVERFTASLSEYPKAKNFHLSNNRLISASLWTPDTTIARGTVFGELQLLNGDKIANDQITPLLSGYITFGTFINFPLSQPEAAQTGEGTNFAIDGSLPAAGAPALLTFREESLTHLNSANLSFTASAAVASRTVTATLLSQTSDILVIRSRTAITASQTRQIYLWAGNNMPADDTSSQYLPLPDLPYLKQLELSIQAINIDAGDQFSALHGQASQLILPQ